MRQDGEDGGVWILPPNALFPAALLFWQDGNAFAKCSGPMLTSAHHKGKRRPLPCLSIKHLTILSALPERLPECFSTVETSQTEVWFTGEIPLQTLNYLDPVPGLQKVHKFWSPQFLFNDFFQTCIKTCIFLLQQKLDFGPPKVDFSVDVLAIF